MKSSNLLLIVIAPAFFSTLLTNYYASCICFQSRELALAFAFTAGGDSTKNRQVVSKWKPRRLSIAIDTSALDLTILVDDNHDLDDRDSQASIDIGRALAINHPPKTDHVSIHISDDALAGDDS
ncbi:uncharacterized protein LOC111457665 isoform X2 [Cucurbita moschata]|uniref:Uncharacterized protein LOC111457665 isoform X1 n=1 Tax=Cucurbita moschata TaxID=3662 RepID=A0A6J1GUT0_CUCMO|nr:uncharacterized protein LOC111457665 isoform X1 [Cucurbita moschata]XP_022955776.1 uncharacterized protein LOC111457665 isoform X2 [Cucurbita moschata]